MTNYKELGAKEMFTQSLVYLYNAYREEGYSAKEAKEKVATHIEEQYHTYGGRALRHGLSYLDDTIRHIQQSSIPPIRKRAVINELEYLKKQK